MTETSLQTHAWQLDDLQRAVKAAGVALWSWEIDADNFRMDAQAFWLWGMPRTGQISFETLVAQIHPADRDHARAAFLATRDLAASYEFDFRVVSDDDVWWLSARGEGAGADLEGGGSVFGIFLDVTARKQAEEGHELFAGEMSHRVKNLLAIAAGLTEITLRSTTTATDLARELTQRLTALGRAHDLVRPQREHDSEAALLGDLLTVLLAPYDDSEAFGGRIRVAVQRIGIGERAATTLALIVHELATNSLKYGALSTMRGTLDIASSGDGDETVVLWTERGGPQVETPTGAGGYGSKLVNRSIAGQLGGSIARQWFPAGLIVTLRMNNARLAS